MSEFPNVISTDYLEVHEPEIMYNPSCAYTVFWKAFHSFLKIRFSKEVHYHPLDLPKLRMINLGKEVFAYK